jgi:pSer/pThr/pTyr-binding forkhead associated (FHA) protein
MVGLNYQVRVVRGIGRSFSVIPVGEGVNEIAEQIAGTFHGSATIDLGVVSLCFTALDVDCCVSVNEAPDRAGVRVLQTACRRPSPHYPALVVRGLYPSVVSMPGDVPVFAGRAKDCLLRFDSADVSQYHAKIGYTEGNFWIEDLGSTNGTFIEGTQISSRQGLTAGQSVHFGREIAIVGVVSDQQLEWVLNAGQDDGVRTLAETARFPILISVSEVARPTRVTMPIGTTLLVGRDPTSDMWLGAPHISRKHATLCLMEDGQVEVTDYSTNGILLNERIIGRGNVTMVENGTAVVLDLGAGMTLGVCFDDQQEGRFVEMGGDLYAFSNETVLTNRTVTDKNLQIEPNLRLRSITERASIAENSDDFMRGRRRYPKHIYAVAGLCAFLITLVLVELYRGFR